tara:strand:+ start:17826 stop:19847 length:2022 start_codon:yes stop_codon:yes gene_type:complete
MAQTIKLRRSSTEGKVPTTSQLALGEIAINTFDGRVFFKKDKSAEGNPITIEHIVTTDSITTGSVSIVGQLTVDDITINGSTISDSGDLTLDIGGDLNIDVDGTDIILKDGGTAFGRFKRDSSDFIIKSEANNEDIIFRGQDAGVTIDALTLDMSEAGAATFGGGIADAGTISAGTWNGSVIDKTYLDDEVLNTSLNAATGSYLTAHPNISAGSNISQNNSNGTVLQDLTITLDSNGHVTTATAGTVNLDGRYYTETESDTLYTKKLGQGIISGAAQITSFGNLEIANPTVTGTLLSEDVIQFTGLSATTETTAVMIDSSNELSKRTLGSNAFNSTAFTTNTGTVTNVTVGTGLDVEDGTTTPSITLDLSEFSETTGFSNSVGDFFIVLDGNAERKTTAGNIPLSIFNNDSGFLTSTGSNAQTVGGISAGSFLRSDATDSAGSKITFSGGLNVPDSTNLEIGTGADFVINDDGTNTFFQSKRHAGEVYFQCENTSGTAQNVIILGTDTSNTAKTYVELRYNNVQRIRTTTDGSDMAGIVNFDGTTQSTSKTTGTVVIDGGVGIAKTLNVGEDVVAYASSDERYKDFITPIENPNEKIKLLSGNTFVWNDKHEVFKGKKDIGVIAQEVEKVLPEIVETRDNGYKAVKYEKIVALLIESNKELIKRVEELESKIK